MISSTLPFLRSLFVYHPTNVAPFLSGLARATGNWSIVYSLTDSVPTWIVLSGHAAHKSSPSTPSKFIETGEIVLSLVWVNNAAKLLLAYLLKLAAPAAIFKYALPT